MSCAGRPVRVESEVRRLCCLNADCAVVTFAEQVEGVTQWRQRRTPGLRHVLERVGLALAGRAGARLAVVLGAVVLRCTMLRLIRALPDPEVGTVRVPGVDEFAKRRGQSYATILIDLDTHRPVDVLDGREAQPLADWLAAHPGVGVVCRDRAGGFAEGARLGAPDARQCADRWHLYNNLCAAVDKTIRANRADLREPIPAGDGQEPPEASGAGTTAAAQNNADTQISEPPEEASRTGTEDLLPSAEASAQLHNFIPYLRKRILDDRCANAAPLFQELREHGYQGSARTLRGYLVPFRDELAARKLPSVPLSGPSTVSVADRTRRRHAEIHALLAQGFNQTQICQITGLSEQTVKKFRRAATADELLGDSGNQYRRFERFVPYQRIMFGRANLDLLRTMILHN
ncbi:ISL3 family transposase ISFsp1 [Streptosporangium roseum]